MSIQSYDHTKYKNQTHRRRDTRAAECECNRGEVGLVGRDDRRLAPIIELEANMAARQAGARQHRVRGRGADRAQPERVRGRFDVVNELIIIITLSLGH